MSTLTIYPTGIFDVDILTTQGALDDPSCDKILFKAVNSSGEFTEWNFGGYFFEDPSIYPEFFRECLPEEFPGVYAIDWDYMDSVFDQKVWFEIKKPVTLIGEIFQGKKTTFKGGRFGNVKKAKVLEENWGMNNRIKINIVDGVRMVEDNLYYNIDGDIVFENIHFSRSYPNPFVITSVHSITFKNILVDDRVLTLGGFDTFPDGKFFTGIDILATDIEYQWALNAHEFLYTQPTLDVNLADIDENGYGKNFGVNLVRRCDQVNIIDCEFVYPEENYVWGWPIHSYRSCAGVLIERSKFMNSSLGPLLEGGYLFEEYEGNGRVVKDSAKNKKSIVRQSTVSNKQHGYSCIACLNNIAIGIKFLPTIIENNVMYCSQNPNWAGWVGSPIDISVALEGLICKNNKCYVGGCEIPGGEDPIAGLVSFWPNTVAFMVDDVNAQLTLIDGVLKSLPPYCLKMSGKFENNLVIGSAQNVVFEPLGFMGSSTVVDGCEFKNNNERKFLPWVGEDGSYTDYLLSPTSTNCDVRVAPPKNQIGNVVVVDLGVNNSVFIPGVTRVCNNVPATKKESKKLNHPRIKS